MEQKSASQKEITLSLPKVTCPHCQQEVPLRFTLDGKTIARTVADNLTERLRDRSPQT